MLPAIWFIFSRNGSDVAVQYLEDYRSGFICDELQRITSIGEQPIPRAAHAATYSCVNYGCYSGLYLADSFVCFVYDDVVPPLKMFYYYPSQGGIGPTCLSAEGLHVLDLNKDNDGIV
ncbi:hypothetical protein FXO37_12154 [Capsicum annuum]|nr:hypothetical protein FXO37_12154 [Capsicum annuum]